MKVEPWTSNLASLLLTLPAISLSLAAGIEGRFSSRRFSHREPQTRKAVVPGGPPGQPVRKAHLRTSDRLREGLPRF